MQENPLVIYHANCADGIGAAYAAWRVFGATAEYLPAQYNDPPPEVAGRSVYILDFSYPRETMIKMADEARTFIVLDHHKTAMEDCSGIEWPPTASVQFDMTHSGAMLAWKYFMPGVPPPIFIEYIEDRDLWQFKYWQSRCLHFWIMLQKRVPEDLDTLRISSFLTEVIERGIAIRDYHDSVVKKIVDDAAALGFGDVDVPAVYCPPHFASDVGNELAKDAPFAALVWPKTADKIIISLRSNKDGGTDVGAIAKRNGGGGHKNAAGFVVSDLMDIVG